MVCRSAPSQGKRCRKGGIAASSALSFGVIFGPAWAIYVELRMDTALDASPIAQYPLMLEAIICQGLLLTLVSKRLPFAQAGGQLMFHLVSRLS